LGRTMSLYQAFELFEIVNRMIQPGYMRNGHLQGCEIVSTIHKTERLSEG